MSRYTEADFGQVVDQAFLFDEFVQKNLMANYYRVMPRDDFPDVTLARLLRWAQILFRSAVALVREPELSYGAEPLLRALLEIWAHVYWLRRDNRGTERQRALCLELGMAGELDAAAAKLPAWITPRPDGTSLALTLREIWQLHQAEGCCCKGRNYGQVQRTLQAMEKEFPQAFEGMLALWKVSSGIAHGMILTRLLRETSPGITTIGPPATYEYRANLLFWLSSAFGNIGLSIATPHPLVWNGMLDRREALRLNPVWQAASKGQMDS